MTGPAPAELRTRLTGLCLALPEAMAEGDRHVGFKVRGRTFAWYLDDHHGDGRVALNCKVPPGEQQALVATDPRRFFVPSYLGARGWIGLRLDLPDTDWAEVAELVTESYRLVAPKGLARRLDGPA